MPLLAAVAHLDPHPDARLRALAALARIPGFCAGSPVEGRLPFVLESTDRDEDRERWEAVAATPGVMHLELVLADFSDLTSPEPESPSAPAEVS